MKNLRILLIALIFLAAGFLFGQSWQVSQINNIGGGSDVLLEGEKVLPVSLMLDFGNGGIKTFTNIFLESEQTVFDVLKILAGGEEGFALDYDPPGEWGVFIKQIGDKKNGEDNKYWQYWVDNEQPMTAADRYELWGGEAIMFKFAESKF